MTPKLLNTLLLGISFFLYTYVASPLYYGKTSMLFPEGESIKMLTEKNSTYTKTIEALPALTAKAIAAEAAYKSIGEKDKNTILVMVPTEINEIKLMSEITDIGAATGLPLDSMGIKDKGNGEYSVSFSVVTTYTNFKTIMKFWENSMRLFRLQSVTFSPGKKEDDPIKFSVELSTYYMK